MLAQVLWSKICSTWYNPLIAACNSYVGGKHGPPWCSPHSTSVASPGVNWYRMWAEQFIIYKGRERLASEVLGLACVEDSLQHQ